ncbi:MAG: RHS repeat-associated core domain-containing protein [Owenweeksia sp.]
MPGRSFNSGDYRFGFNGHEMDDEVKGTGNHLSFGDYGYDPRLGRRWQIDPKTKKYPDISPYATFANNPISFTDPDGKEPVRKQTGTIENAVAYLKKENATTIEQIIEVYNGIGEDDEVPEGFVRYVYTEKNGWIDLKHYFNAAMVSTEVGDLAAEAAGEAVELNQERKKQGSAYSYEDLPSNRMGASLDTRKGLKDGFSVKEGEDLFKEVEEQFEDAEATSPENAPNWKQMPETKTRPYGKVPQNKSYEPLDLSNFPAAETSIEKQKEKQE